MEASASQWSLVWGIPINSQSIQDANHPNLWTMRVARELCMLSAYGENIALDICPIHGSLFDAGPQEAPRNVAG